MKKVGEQQYTVRMTVILDNNLSFQGLPIELRLVRSEIWNMEDHIRLNTSIKTTLNNFAVYTTSRTRLVAPTRPFTPSNTSVSESRRQHRAWVSQASFPPCTLNEILQVKSQMPQFASHGP
ncbi:unnamed protein product [Echinostoma caproni]|uniref:Peptidase M12B domain-containing protein n=1 Tax=Echinostoma caproni TaxID=27848 RepID=A0A183BFJ7_9TREM|nr:unnamed protein product [Echinostoma caproni]